MCFHVIILLHIISVHTYHIAMVTMILHFPCLHSICMCMFVIGCVPLEPDVGRG